MKTILTVIVLIAFFAVAGYYSLPVLIERETGGLKNEVRDLRERMQKVEDLVRKEEETKRVVPLQPEADVRQIVKTVNGISLQLSSLEKRISGTDEEIKKSQSAREEALKKQIDEVITMNKEIQTQIQKIRFNNIILSMREQLLKARMDIVSKNIGTAKAELDLLSDAYEKAKAEGSEERRKTLEELQGILNKAKADIDTDLPAAIQRIEILWHEMGTLLRKR
jgi:predicted  nucleic acid-binding Zn-ribbon protein